MQPTCARLLSFLSPTTSPPKRCPREGAGLPFKEGEKGAVAEVLPSGI